MAHSDRIATRGLKEFKVALFWPMPASARMGEQGLEDLYAENPGSCYGHPIDLPGRWYL